MGKIVSGYWILPLVQIKNSFLNREILSSAHDNIIHRKIRNKTSGYFVQTLMAPFMFSMLGVEALSLCPLLWDIVTIAQQCGQILFVIQLSADK